MDLKKQMDIVVKDNDSHENFDTFVFPYFDKIHLRKDTQSNMWAILYNKAVNRGIEIGIQKNQNVMRDALGIKNKK